MLFNSIQFLIFITIVYSLYLMLNHRRQNYMLLIASYVFYAAWDWRFLSLIMFSTVLDYWCGIKIYEAKTPKRRKSFLLLSVIVNLSLLCVFKYSNFFMENFIVFCNMLGVTMQPRYLNIILPMGISFYTFQTMSYTIDIYRKELKPVHHFFDFALFVSFFPQLVAGPIERAKNLLPQICKPRKLSLEHFYEGSFLILWGIFQKVFIADNLAILVDPVYAMTHGFKGAEVLIATYGFTFQIFCDFAGYSNVARGLGKIMGFEIMLNFNLPFFVTNIQDYWNRWHISLSSWLRDYCYIPMFRWLRMVKGNVRIYMALMSTMILIGLWHGAAWNFVVFGVYYGLLLCAYVVIRTKCYGWIQPKSVWGERLWVFIRMVFMFQLINIGMLIFRCPTVPQIFNMLGSIIFNFKFEPYLLAMCAKIIFYTWILIAVWLVQYFKKDLMAAYNAHLVVKVAFYTTCFILVTLHGVMYGKEFIYFQF